MNSHLSVITQAIRRINEYTLKTFCVFINCTVCSHGQYTGPNWANILQYAGNSRTASRGLAFIW